MTRESNKRWKEKRRAEGGCILCCSPAVSGYVKCQKHIDENRRRLSTPKMKEWQKNYDADLVKIKNERNECLYRSCTKKRVRAKYCAEHYASMRLRVTKYEVKKKAELMKIAKRPLQNGLKLSSLRLLDEDNK